MAKKNKGLPKIVYVYKEEDGEESYFVAYDKLYDCGEMGETRLVGTYELQGTVKLETKTVTTVV